LPGILCFKNNRRDELFIILTYFPLATEALVLSERRTWFVKDIPFGITAGGGKKRDLSPSVKQARAKGKMAYHPR